MYLTKEELKNIFLTSANILKEHIDELSKIDSQFGDGDHGITINKIADVIIKEILEWDENTSIKDFINNLGDKIMGVNGGSAGPLWGTMISGLSIPLNDEKKLSIENIKAMFTSALKEMRDITTAKVGDKTMMDTLIPAVEAIEKSETKNFADLFKEGAQAAEQGAEDTKKYISKFGRAKSYKEQTLGYKDAGATSLAYMFRGFAESFNK